jgi:ABC-type antimicrobial peptide transport system, permease component
VGEGFFETLRAKPLVGRVFTAEEDAPARGHVVVLSNGFWKSHFGGSSDAIGRTLTLDGEAYTVIGVMPAVFSIASWSITHRDIWVPIAYKDSERAVRDNHNDSVVARLKPGADLAQAEAEMRDISVRLEREYPKENAGWGATVVPLQELIVGDIRTSLVMLLAAVALVLLIACANVGNLLFARALSRGKELAIRAALGAGRARVFQQLIVEAIVLAMAGGVAGLLIARVSLAAGATCLRIRCPARTKSPWMPGNAVRARRVDSDGCPGWSPSGDSRRPHRREQRVEGGRPQRRGQRGPSHPAAAHRLRGGAFPGAAHRRRRDDSQPAGASERGRRFRSSQCADHAGGFARDALQDTG